MLMGTAAMTDDPQVRARYLARQPEAEMFAGFADFSFYRIDLKGAHLVAGFGRIVDLKPQDILTPVDDAAELVARRARHSGAHERRPRRHLPALCDQAARRAGRRRGAASAAIPRGSNCRCERMALRLPFRERVRSPGVLRQVLKQFAEEARAA